MAALFPHYTGNPDNRREGKWRDLPVADTEKLKDPSHYLAPPALAAAVNVALELGMPLLLTGDPGCGKSRLADAVAWELGFPDDKALRFVVTSDTVKRDLFYEFDTIGRFRAAQDTQNQAHQAHHFIKYNALGLAILRANGRKEEYKNIMREQDWLALPKEGSRSVVLIDEIDKAPREVPNDLLTQLEDLSFNVPELFHEADIKLEESQQDKRPAIIITSNSERDTPAFLRRCIYFHVELPPFQAEGASDSATPPVTIERIVNERLGARFAGRDKLLQDALALFRHFRNSSLEQKPSLAELLAWLLYLSKRPPSGSQGLREHPELEASLGVLVKPHHDSERQRRDQLFQEWLKPAK